jgi:hypothetical protein
MTRRIATRRYSPILRSTCREALICGPYLRPKKCVVNLLSDLLFTCTLPMARLQNPKRRRPDDLPHDVQPSKRVKLRGEFYRTSNFPPEFWDNLSMISLTSRALRELDRRHNNQLGTNLTALGPPRISPVSQKTAVQIFAIFELYDMVYLS